MNPSPEQAPYRAQAEIFSRSKRAAVRRNMADLYRVLEHVQRNLFETPVTQTNAEHVARQFLAAAELKEAIRKNQPEILESLPPTRGSKLSEPERREIAGFYATGLYTQEELAAQYGVSQATVHGVIASRRPIA